MVRKLPDIEQPGAKETFQQIVRAYETLTKEEKFNNWMEYGDPEGSLMRQSFDVAIPSWMMEEKNQIYILVFIFVLFVIIPIIAISSTKDELKYHQNGIDRRSDEIMSSVLFDFIDRNQRKKLKQISDDQWVEVMENSLEFLQLNYELAKKINIRDLIRNKINN